jgi:hypothetical protein
MKLHPSRKCRGCGVVFRSEDEGMRFHSIECAEQHRHEMASLKSAYWK